MVISSLFYFLSNILRCRTGSFDVERFSRETGRTYHSINVEQSVWVNYEWIEIDTRVTVNEHRDTESVRTRATEVKISLSTLQGEVDVKVYAVFYAQPHKDRIIADVKEKVLRVDRTTPDIVLHSRAIEDYDGYAVAVFNLATGKLLETDGSTHYMEKQLKKDIKHPKGRVQ